MPEHITFKRLDAVRTASPPPQPPPFVSTWEPMDFPFGRALYGVWLPSRSRFVVVGFSYDESLLPTGDYIAFSDDNGESWDTRSVPGWTLEWPGNLNIDYSPSQDRIIVPGGRNSGGTFTHTAYSDDGGDTWTHNPITLTGTFPTWYDAPADCLSVKWIEEQSQWLFGTPNTSTSPTGIDSFTKRYFNNDGGSAQDFAYSPIDDRIVMVRGGRIITSDNSGVSWTVRTTPFDSGQIAFVEWLPSRSKFVAGCNDASATHSIMYSDDGITWSVVSTTPEDPGLDPTSGDFHAQTLAVTDLNTQLLASATYAFSPPYVKASNDLGMTWPDTHCDRGLLSFANNDDFVLGFGYSIDGIGAVMRSPIPVGTP